MKITRLLTFLLALLIAGCATFDGGANDIRANAVVVTAARPANVDIAIDACKSGSVCEWVLLLDDVEFAASTAALRLTASVGASQQVSLGTIYSGGSGEAESFSVAVSGIQPAWESTMKLRIEPLDFGQQKRDHGRTKIGSIKVESVSVLAPLSVSR